MNTKDDMINILPKHFFGSLKDKMKMGFLPSEAVEEILFPVLKDYKKTMLKLPQKIQMDIREILSIYPELALEYKIKISPAYNLISIMSTINEKINFNFIIMYFIPIIAIAFLTFPGIGIIQKNIPLFIHLVLTIAIAFSCTNILIHRKAVFSNSISITLCCLLTIFLSYPESLPNLIKNSYKIALKDNITFEDTRKFLWEKQTFGAVPIDISEESRAFAAGLYSGRNLLLSKEQNIFFPDFFKPESNKQANEYIKWEQTNYSIYYHTAKWTYLLKNVCINCENIKRSFMKQQIEIINELRNQFYKNNSQKENQIIKTNITEVENILNNQVSEYPDKVQCKNIIIYLNNIIEYYSPETMY